jgi:hypothetical protein
MRRKGKTLSNEDVGYLVYEKVVEMLTTDSDTTALSWEKCTRIARHVQSSVYQELEKEVK